MEGDVFMKLFKKIILIAISILMIVSFIACSKETEQKTNSESTKADVKKEEKKDENKIQLPSDIKDKGKGSVQIATPSGTSENGQVPFIYADKDTMLTQIGLNSSEFDGSKLSYLIIDGMLNDKEQLGDSQISLSLQKELLNVGKHKVEVVQYDNDKIDGNIITYKVASYEVKAK